MRCAIWYHLYNLKNVKNTHGSVNFSKGCSKLTIWLQTVPNGKVGFFQWGCSFYIKNKVKSEIFNYKKKFIKKKVFLCHN